MGCKEAVDEETKSEDDDEAADANRLTRHVARVGQQDDHAETNGDEDDAGAPVAGRHVAALEPLHGVHPPVEPLGIRLRGRHHASFDHRDALADFQLADPPPRHRGDNAGERSRPQSP